MRNKGIIRIVLAIHSLKWGGMERVMAELIDNFSKRENAEIHVILFGRTREIFYPIPPGIKIHKPEFTFKDNHRFFYTFLTLIFLRKTIRLLKPDTVLSFGEYWNSLLLISTLGLKIPVFVSDRSQPDKSLGKTQDWLRRKLYPYASGVIAQTEKAAQIYKGMYKPKRIAVIGNPIRHIAAGKNEKENEILMVARLIGSKHQDRLIKIFAKLDRVDWKLVFVGDDDLKQENRKNLEQLAELLGIKDRVLFLGNKSNVEKYYQRAKIFAFTSSSEGFPNVIGEAMSAGMPVVAYDCIAGPSEMIENGKNGYLVPLYDDSMFIDKLNSLLNDHLLQKKLGKQAQQDIQKYKSDLICEKFYQFIVN